MSIPEEFIKGRHVEADWVDLRDQPYAPGLSVLRETTGLDPRLMKTSASGMLKQPLFGIRHQKDTKRCVGYALAALIDIQRSLQWLGGAERHDRAMQEVGTDESERLRLDIASADMLYRMAFFHENYQDLTMVPGFEGVRSLRSAIKGFYHHGACLDWPKATNPTDDGRWQSTSFSETSRHRDSMFPNVAQSKAARAIGLGAYFRLASILNHYHAALNDAQAVLCSANVHDGWLRASSDNGGKIEWPPQQGKTGAHAVVLTGYDKDGFHVLNSWGEDWGGYKGQAGIGLWHYEDWAQNVIDAWVLRLGISAPKAFGFTQGLQGVQGLYGPIQSGSTPCYELVGHYMHLDDGYHVSTGSYPSFAKSWDKTRTYLSDAIYPRPDRRPRDGKAYRGVLIWIPGTLEGIKQTFTQAVSRKTRIKNELSLYPYNVFWCNSFVEKSLEVLEIIFESCKSQTGADAEHLDQLIEDRVHGVGRAFWREMETSAQRAVHGTMDGPAEVHTDKRLQKVKPGYLAKLLRSVMKLKSELKCEVHLVAEGSGALVVHEMLAAIRRDEQRAPETKPYFCAHDPADLFDSLHLVHPSISWTRAQTFIVPLIQKMNERAHASKRCMPDEASGIEAVSETNTGGPARIYVPSDALEAQLRFGAYGKSLLHLASRAFEDKLAAPNSTESDPVWEPQEFLGMACMDRKRSLYSALYRLYRVGSKTRPDGEVTQTELSRDETIQESIFRAIACMQGLGFQKK